MFMQCTQNDLKAFQVHSWSYPSAHHVRKKWAHLETFIITSTALFHDLFIGVCQLLRGQNMLLLPRNFPKGWKCANQSARCRGYLHVPKLPQHMQMARFIIYQHWGQSNRHPKKTITKSLICMFPSPESPLYRHLYPDGIAWQWADRPFNTGAARETSNMSSKTSGLLIDLRLWTH